MLKIVKTSLVIAATSLFFAGNANADVNQALANICNIVKANDKGELRKKMKKVESDYRLKLQDYYSGVSCGGNSMIRLAFTSNAIETGTLLLKKLPKSYLAEPESDGKTLSIWVAENGMSTSPIAATLKERT